MRIAIIGAGIAGLTAARELQALGHKVDLFEKSRGRGGRVSTKRLEWGAADTGAQYFTARDARFAAEVASWLQQGVAAQWHFSPYKLVDGELRPSPDSEQRYVGTPGMNQIGRFLADGLNIEFNLRVECLIRRQQHWYLVDTGGDEWGAYDWVIGALPAAQGAALIQDLSLADQVPDGVLQPCWALVLATRGEVDRKIQGIFGDELVSWVSRVSAKPGRDKPIDSDDLWVLHFTPSWSKDRDAGAIAEVTTAGTAWLSNALRQQLVIAHHYCHFWRYAQLSKRAEITGPLVDGENGLALIGDWCSGGRVEGAYLSAQSLMDGYFR